MAFTVLFAVLAFLALIIVFGITYKIKGVKIAFLTTGIALAILAILFVATIYIIVSVMPN
jgi:hypothetical protein